MAVLTETEMKDLILDALQSNVAVDLPFAFGAGTEGERHINDAYAQVWELSGGGVLAATGGAAWTPAPTVSASGKVTGVLTNVDEILHVWASTSGTSVGGEAGDLEMDHVELSEIQFYRQSQGQGTYPAPKLWAATRLRTTVDADVNKFRLDVYPGVVGFHFPIDYVPQFTPLNGTTIVVPDVNDLESRDIAYLAALAMAPLEGRAELAPTIAMKVSEKTRLGLERKASALLHGKQDK